MANTRLRKSSFSRVIIDNSLAENNIEQVNPMKRRNLWTNKGDGWPIRLIQNSLSMIIKITHTVPLIGFAHLINPLDKEKYTLPRTIGVCHPRYQPQSSPTTLNYKSPLTRLSPVVCSNKKNSSRVREQLPSLSCSHNTFVPMKIL